MDLVGSGRDAQLEQSGGALDSAPGNAPVADQTLGALESQTITLDALSRRAAKRRTKTGCLSK